MKLVSINGEHFIGTEHLPNNLTLDLEHIRKWALKKKIINSFSLVTEEQFKTISPLFTDEDRLLILISIRKNNGELLYNEDILVPTTVLIKQQKELIINYFELVAVDEAAKNRNIYSEVRFHFYYPELPEEGFFGLSTGKSIIPKFLELAQQVALDSEFSLGENGKYNEEYISLTDCWCMVRATFRKSGRFHDVELMIVKEIE
jgi:hypothetical protein